MDLTSQWDLLCQEVRTHVSRARSPVAHTPSNSSLLSRRDGWSRSQAPIVTAAVAVVIVGAAAFGTRGTCTDGVSKVGEKHLTW